MTSTSAVPVAFEAITGQYIHSHHQIPQDTWKKNVVLKLPGQSDTNTTISDAIASIEHAAGNPNPMSVHSMSNLVETFNNPEDARLAAAIDEKTGIFSNAGWALIPHIGNHPGYSDFVARAITDISRSEDMSAKEKQYALYNLDRFADQLFAGKIVDPFSEFNINGPKEEVTQNLMDLWTGLEDSSWSGQYIDPANPSISDDLRADLDAAITNYESSNGYSPNTFKPEAVEKLFEAAKDAGIFSDERMQDFLDSKDVSAPSTGIDNWHRPEGIEQMLSEGKYAGARASLFSVIESFANVIGVANPQGRTEPYQPYHETLDPGTDNHTVDYIHQPEKVIREHIVDSNPESIASINPDFLDSIVGGAKAFASSSAIRSLIINKKGAASLPSHDVDRLVVDFIDDSVKLAANLPNILSDAVANPIFPDAFPQSFDDLPPMLRDQFSHSFGNLVAGVGGSWVGDTVEAMNFFYDAMKVGVMTGDWSSMKDAGVQYGASLALSFVLVGGTTLLAGVVLGPAAATAVSIGWAAYGIYDAVQNGSELISKIAHDLSSVGGISGAVDAFLSGVSKKTGTDEDDIIVLDDNGTLVIDSLGDDIYLGGEGQDTLSFANEDLGLKVDSNGFVYRTDLNGDVIEDGDKDGFEKIDHFIFTEHNDIVDLSTIDQSMAINGNGGIDTLVGGTGSDTFILGNGSAKVDGGHSTEDDEDIADYSRISSTCILGALEKGIFVDGQMVSHAMNEALGPDLLADIETLNATKFDDDISNLNVSTIWSGSGNDNVDQSDLARDHKIYGQGGNDILAGGLGNDRLDGGDGNDSLMGGDGNDNAHGGNGNDTYYSGDGTDNFYGGAGKDTFDFLFAEQSVVINTINSENKIIKNDGFGKIEYLWNGFSIEVIKGSDQNDSLNLKGSTVREIHGRGGNDSIHGSTSSDKIYGNDGDDWLVGDSGNDTIYGGAGNDMLKGWSGTDHLYGGSGQDYFELAYTGTDIVYDFEGPGAEEGDRIYIYGASSASIGTGKGQVSFVNHSSGRTLVRYNDDYDSNFERTMYLDDGNVDASAYSIDDFVFL